MDPSAALVEINDEISRLRLLATAGTDAEKAEQAKMLEELYADGKDELVLNAYLKKLEGYETEAKGLTGKLLAADTQSKRESIKAQLRTNQEATDVVRRSARELLAGLDARIADAKRKAAPPKTP